jgi:pimeloyl-ACP methyl ester carboxylesterase
MRRLSPWLKTSSGQAVALGFRSRIDGTVQPYGIVYPQRYGEEANRKWRVDVVLHGRDSTLTEVKFLNAHSGVKPVAAEQDFVQIDIFGRGNNAYRWAGETDVFEAFEAFLSREQAGGRGRHFDPRRVVLRGFSMGGAGTWHLGLHWPSRWCVLGPGAGFTTTHGYTKLPELTPYQEACLKIYDAVDYAENVFGVPVVAYSGAIDPQKLAADNIEKRVQALGLSQRMTHLVAPDLAHKFPPEWFQKASTLYNKFAAQGRPAYPPEVRFVTYTLKYPACDWVELFGLEKHYERAEVRATRTGGGFRIQTRNVRALRLALPEGEATAQDVEIDGQTLSARPLSADLIPYHIYLDKRAGRWQSVWPQRLVMDRARQPQKFHKLQGPIDDAFTERFLCVRGTGQAWHAGNEQLVSARLERFKADWARYWRGSLPVKDDVDVTSADIAQANLILFGDPSSNSLIAQVLDGLPLRWTAAEIVLAGRKHPAQGHLPVLIYPSPLNTARYVVLNCGPTIPSEDYQKTNALLYPRLGDYAVLRRGANQSMEIADAGLFDEFWQPAR